MAQEKASPSKDLNWKADYNHSIPEEEITGYIRLPKGLFGGIEVSHIRTLSSDRMEYAGLQKGDMLIFSSDLEPMDGDIVDATVDGQQMCRRFFRQNGEVHFRVEDGIGEDIVTTDYTIQGVLVSFIRNCRNMSDNYDPNDRVELYPVFTLEGLSKHLKSKQQQ